MENIKQVDRKAALWTLGSTVLFSLAAHGFRYFSLGNSHDSLDILQSSAAWQISLGRFLQPVYIQLRGSVCAPFLIGLFSIVWLSAAAYLIIALLGLRTKPAIITCGILATSATLALSNATYLPWSDIFMLSLLFAVFAVYLTRAYRYGFLLGAIPVALSLALYQSYVETAALLFLFLLVKDSLNRYSVKEILIRAAKALGALVIGFALYYLVLKLVLRVTGVPLADSYNGISGVSDYSGVSILQLLKKTYLYPIYSMLHPTTFHPKLAVLLNIGIGILSAAGTLRIAIRQKLTGWHYALTALLIALMPFGANFIYFVSKGLIHALMTFSFNLLYIYAVWIAELQFDSLSRRSERAESTRRTSVPRVGRVILFAAAGVLILNNIVYSNQLYLKKSIEFQATLITMNRVIDRIEQTDGYVFDETPVVFVGLISDSKLSQARPVFQDIDAIGMSDNYSVTYLDTYQAFFDNILGYPIQMVDDADLVQAYSERADIQEMPTFPDAGSVQMMDGILFVKFS